MSVWQKFRTFAKLSLKGNKQAWNLLAINEPKTPTVMSKNKKNKKFNKNMNPTEKNQPQDEEVLKNQEAAEAAIDEETQKEAAEELDAEEKVSKELAEAQKTIEEQHDKYLRLSAEFDNYRKRTMKEKAELIKNGGEKTITAILPVLDDLERAIKTSETSDDVKAMREGIELIYNKFLKVLNQEGLQKIETDGEDFDTDYHEAIALVPAPSEDKKGKILDCVQTGYKLNDKVIRHAKVVVAQ